MDWLTLLPPLAGIILTLWWREVISALLGALFTAQLLLVGQWNPLPAFLGTVEALADVFRDPGNTRILLFSLMIGGVLGLMRKSGGLAAVVRGLTRVGVAGTPRRASGMTAAAGVFIFIETNLSILTSGLLARGLFDRLGMSRERLAYIIDSTCAPVAVLILLNGWGAYVLGLVESHGGADPLRMVVYSVPLNFYALLTLALVFYTVVTGRTHGPMKATRPDAARQATETDEPEPTRKRYMLVPLGTLIGGMLFGLWWTGDGDLLDGSGSKAVFWATAAALLVAWLLLLGERQADHQTLRRHAFDGMAELLPIVSTVLIAIALGASLQTLGTGEYVAGLVSAGMPHWLLAPAVFVAAGIIAFTTGTSWGTFALMIPIALPVADQAGLDPSLALAAVLGGGVFGDHCSPISDTTLISSLAAGCNHLDHVRTQLPYALVTGTAAIVMYGVAGLF